MYDPKIPGVGWRMRYDRLERAYNRLQASHGGMVEYGDDLQHFFQNCLHLVDWVGRDKATGIHFKDIRNEMLSVQALKDAADLANASKHLVLHSPGGAYATSGNVTVFPGHRPAEISVVITRTDGTTLSVQDLVRDAFAAWQSILRAHGLI